MLDKEIHKMMEVDLEINMDSIKMEDIYKILPMEDIMVRKIIVALMIVINLIKKTNIMQKIRQIDKNLNNMDIKLSHFSKHL